MRFSKIVKINYFWRKHLYIYAMIKVLYCDIESILKVNGGLCSPFKIQRGIDKAVPFQACCIRQL